MLNKHAYLSEVEKIMALRAGEGHWCYYAVPVKGGGQIGTCSDTEGGYHLLDASLFYGRSLAAMENEASELNSSRLQMSVEQATDIIARSMAQAAFKRMRNHR
jgi:hypothetical protein